MPAVPKRLFIGSHSLRTTRLSLRLQVQSRFVLQRGYAQQPDNPSAGTTAAEPSSLSKSRSPFYFEAGYALFAKRPSRPFPPPFLSYPSGSFSDPLTRHDKSRDKRPQVNGELIRGTTNGDDAVLVSDYFIGASDGVGAWATKDKGHAALWSRLILHFWLMEAEKAEYGDNQDPDPRAYLQRAYEQTKHATSEPHEVFGTTTASGALLGTDFEDPPHAILHVTQLGDSQVLVIRPRDKQILFKTEEQTHWFDCPRQLGTNSPDTPENDAVVDRIQIEEGDVVVAMSDGVIDNLWDHEVMTNVVDSINEWETGEVQKTLGKQPAECTYADGMQYVAQTLVTAARKIAEDPFAESPYMEKAIDEGLSIEGGKLDDISVVAALCRRRKI